MEINKFPFMYANLKKNCDLKESKTYISRIEESFSKQDNFSLSPKFINFCSYSLNSMVITLFFSLRGLVLDIKRGNILKLGKDGFILR